MDGEQGKLFDVDPQPWEFDDLSEACVASIVFTEAVTDAFDYLVPDNLRGEVAAGKRVKVPFGRGNRSMIGYCVDVKSGTVTSGKLKQIQQVIDAEPLISTPILRLARWMAEYYLAPLGRVLEGMVPAGVRGQAGTRKQKLLTVRTGVAAKITQLKLPRKQAQVLTILAASPRPMTAQQLASAAKCTNAPVNSLIKKGLVEVQVRRTHRDDVTEPEREPPASVALNADQQAAVSAALDALRAARHETILLHGVTGSGKTEVYIRVIEEVVQYGRQAIVLVPEISLTPQTQRRFRSRFDSVAVLHSHLSDAHRHWHWQRIAAGQVQVVVGARSAVFAPVPQLGLIVLDEEHDNSFKQDSVPRYHARDVAKKRAQAEQVPLILGSATPSLESWLRARDGLYRLIDLPSRVLDLPLPDVLTIDMRDEFRSQFSRGAISRRLQQGIRQALDEDGQIILLLNRRGFSTHIQCPACGEVVRCPHCDIALTHHRQGEKAVCHYCDFEIQAPPRCPACGFEGIRYGGLGTQRLEAEVRSRFPDASCLRMDSDTMQGASSYEESLARFRSGAIRILLGTQMIAKGLDFPNVTLVGVINADTALHLPDFRAGERTFQLVTQVAGRTGRGEKGGRVFVQTFSPDHDSIKAAQRHDFLTFAERELSNRQQFGYPPYGWMIRLIVRGESESRTEQFIETIADFVRRHVDQDSTFRLLGPAPAPIAKLRGKFRFHLLMQSGETSQSMRETLRLTQATLHAPDDIQWIVDVDPLDML